MTSSKQPWRDNTGRESYIPHAALLVELHHRLARGEAPIELRKRFGITERTLYRYRKQLMTSKKYLRAKWWLDNQERIQAMRGRGCFWSDIYARLKPPAFSNTCDLRQFIHAETMREIEDRNIAA
jgi:hypothetical protein